MFCTYFYISISQTLDTPLNCYTLALFIVQDPCQKSSKHKKKHLKVLKCLKNKEIKFKDYVYYRYYIQT